MCEPTNSIVQFPDHDDDDTPTAPLIEAIPMEQSKKQGLWDWAKKKIGNWFHFSKLGNGHSESIGLLSLAQRRRLPQDTKYEAFWWNRTVRLDGPFYGRRFDKDEALDCATGYAKLVSIGGLTQLRRFLEVSMRKSERAASYIDAFYQILTKEGYDLFNRKLKQLFGDAHHAVKTKLDSTIKFLLGFTRKRELLVPEWADDQSLWTPKIVLG